MSDDIRTRPGALYSAVFPGVPAALKRLAELVPGVADKRWAEDLLAQVEALREPVAAPGVAMKTTAESRAALRRLSDEATPGPWTITHAEWEYDHRRVQEFRNAENKDIVEVEYDTDYYDGVSDMRLAMDKCDASFIAEARNALPDLLDDVAALEAQFADERAKVERLATAMREIRSRLNSPAHPGSVALQIHRLIDAALAELAK